MPWVTCALSLGTWAPGTQLPVPIQAAAGLWTHQPHPEAVHRPSQGAAVDFFRKTTSTSFQQDS